VFDAIQDEEGALIVMEYVKGETLADAVKRGPLRPERVAEIVRDLASALDHAHANGVLHRDVKPANILLREDGLVKLADLGIATGADHTRITLSGVVLGTASYMSPEQVEGEEVGPASDVYSLAAVAYEALSGRKARSGGTPMEVARQIVAGPPPELTEAWPKAPKAAGKVLAQGMARDPADRPASAGALAQSLERTLRKPRDKPAAAPLPRREAPRRGRQAPAPASAATPPASAPKPPAATPAPPVTRGRSRRSWVPAAAIVGLLIVAAIAVAALGGGDSGDGDGRESGSQADRSGAPARGKKQKKAKRPEAEQAPAPAAPAAPVDEEPVATGDPGNGAALNAEGYDLMQAGRYEEAIPVLQEAVASFPEGSDDINYAYALFNLGRSLLRAGRADEAVPVLERRLQIPDQTEKVRLELEAARRAAGQS
jgi:serine/threonine-protein kinase